MSLRTSFLLVTGTCLLFSSSSIAQTLSVGVAEADITPPVGFPMAGYYHERLAEGTADPLKAKAMVLRQGDTSAAFVIADLTGIARDLCVEVRKAAADKTGIPEKHIVVSATHSHTAPDYTGHLYRYLDKSRDRDTTNSYPQKLIDGCVTAIVKANATSEPVSIAAGTGKQEVPIAFNRRFEMKDGSIRTWQNFTNPDVVRAAGPVDPDVSLIAIKSVDDKTKGVFSNFALHLDTVGGKRWSADYPYFVEQRLRKVLGSEMVSIFGLGCCGDINHSDPNRKERNKTPFIGNALADTVQSALSELRTVEKPQLRVRSEVVSMWLQDVSQQDLNRAMELIPIARTGEKVDFFHLVAAYKAVVLDHLQNKDSKTDHEKFLSWGLTHTWRGIGGSLPVELTVMTIGDDVGIVFLPGEVFVSHGLAIKKASPYPTTFVVELSNCVETMYIPTQRDYAGGGYEVVNSAVVPSSGELIATVAGKLLQTMRKDRAVAERTGVHQVIAHRGSSADRPENTVAAIKRAIEAGATATEIDVRTSKDGHLVILHDETLDRTTNGTGRVEENTLEQLQQLDAGSWFDPDYADERIPTLIESLEACGDNIDVLLDLKGAGDEYVNAVIQTIIKHGRPERTIIGVRSIEQAKMFRERLPAARQLGLIASPADIEAFATAGVETIRLWPKWLDDSTLIQRVKESGAKLHLNGTNGSRKEVSTLLRKHPFSLSSDDPATLKKSLSTWRKPTVYL